MQACAAIVSSMLCCSSPPSHLDSIDLWTLSARDVMETQYDLPALPNIVGDLHHCARGHRESLPSHHKQQ